MCNQRNEERAYGRASTAGNDNFKDSPSKDMTNSGQFDLDNRRNPEMNPRHERTFAKQMLNSQEPSFYNPNNSQGPNVQNQQQPSVQINQDQNNKSSK